MDPLRPMVFHGGLSPFDPRLDCFVYFTDNPLVARNYGEEIYYGRLDLRPAHLNRYVDAQGQHTTKLWPSHASSCNAHVGYDRGFLVTSNVHDHADRTCSDPRMLSTVYSADVEVVERRFELYGRFRLG